MEIFSRLGCHKKPGMCRVEQTCTEESLEKNLNQSNWGKLLLLPLASWGLCFLLSPAMSSVSEVSLKNLCADADRHFICPGINCFMGSAGIWNWFLEVSLPQASSLWDPHFVCLWSVLNWANNRNVHPLVWGGMSLVCWCIWEDWVTDFATPAHLFSIGPGKMRERLALFQTPVVFFHRCCTACSAQWFIDWKESRR